jgi:hypothetical protein
VEMLHALGAGEDPCSVHQRLPAAWNAALVSVSRSCGVAVSSRSVDLGVAGHGIFPGRGPVWPS